MRPLKVLIVDDEVVYRAMVSTALKDDADFGAAILASEGAMALDLIDREQPDVVTLDLDMPGMDGRSTLLELRRRHPKLPVVILSAFAHPSMSELDLLAVGADDCVTKIPHGGMTSSLAWMREHIFPRLKQAVARRNPRPPDPRLPGGLPGVRQPRPASRDAAILAIAASAGGPDAVESVLAALPGDLPVPIVVVQHMPPDFTRLYAERLQRRTPFTVVEGRAGAELVPGCAWVAPGGSHMVTSRVGDRVLLEITADPPENGCRPAADPLFRSVAKVFGASSLAVVISGMGCDGLRGCEHLHEAGAQIVVQDEATSVVWGMPGAVAKAGLADAVVPLSRIPEEIVARIAHTGHGVAATSAAPVVAAG